MPRLTGEQVGGFQTLLTQRFQIAELTQIALVRLEQTLGNIVGLSQPFGQVAFDLIVWSEARGRTGDLIRAVSDARAGVPEVVAACAALLAAVAAAPAAVAADAARARELSIAFRARFDERRQWFRYLNSSKQLHEVLHKLQNDLRAVDEAVEAFDGNVPETALGVRRILEILEDYLIDADEAVRNTETPESPPDWLTTFRKYVGVIRTALAPPNRDAMGLAAERIAALPNQQAGLNRDLVNYARRLGADDLATRLAAILAALGGPADTDPGRRMDRFRELCRQTAGAIVDHDACQRIDTALAGLPSGPVAAAVPEWPDILAELLRVAARRPDDPRAARVAVSARDYNVAAGAEAEGALILLRDHFDRLFSRLDKELFGATDELVRQVDLLAAALP